MNKQEFQAKKVYYVTKLRYRATVLGTTNWVDTKSAELVVYTSR
jgi:hypothetical protein